METSQLIALFSFAVVSVVTPGPNNIMLMASGANVGFKKTIPHMLGVTFGFGFMVVVVGLGLMEIFSRYPVTQQILQWVCIGYLFVLAYKIATSRSKSESQNDFRPISFLTAASFQWANPKAWTMAITAISVYNTSASLNGVLLVCLAFTVANLPSVSLWTAVGIQIQRFLSTRKRIAFFNYSMAGLLLLSVLPML